MLLMKFIFSVMFWQAIDRYWMWKQNNSREVTLGLPGDQGQMSHVMRKHGLRPCETQTGLFGYRSSNVAFRSRLMTKPTKWYVCPAKTQISLGTCPVWSESSLCAQWVAKDPSFLHAHSKDADQTGGMPRLIWVFAGCTTTLLVLSWGGSYQV